MADKALAVSGVWVGGVGGYAVGNFGILQNRQKAAALDMPGDIDPAKFTKGGVEVYEFGGGSSFPTCSAYAHMAYDQGHAGIDLEISVLAPGAMVTEFPAMVGPESDNGILCNA